MKALLLALVFPIVSNAAVFDRVFESFKTDHLEDSGTGYEFGGGAGHSYSGDFPADAEERQGSLVMSTGATGADSRRGMYVAGNNYFLPGIIQTSEWRACLPTASTSSLRYNAYIGYSGFGFVGGSYPRGPFFMYNDNENDGKWQFVLRKWTAGGDVDVVRGDTGIAWDEHCHIFKVQVDPQKEIKWFIDGKLVGQTASALPTSSELMYPFAYIEGVSGAGARLMVLDWFDIQWFKE
jgi:hypothetical protein